MFDLLNSRNPYAHGTKAPVSLHNLERWNDSCNNIAEYIFALKDERGNYIRTGHRKTAVWCFTFSIRSIQSIVTKLLKRTYRPYKHVLTYKLSQDNIELLFNKIRQCCGWNNNPNVLQFKYALRQNIIRNSIEPSKTGNCTNFKDSLCQTNGLLDYSWKPKHVTHLEECGNMHDEYTAAEHILIHIDDQSPNCLQDNILYYIGGLIVHTLLQELECAKCKKELLLDPDNPTARNMTSYPVFAKFTQWKQYGSLVLPSPAVLRMLKATEVIFKRMVIDTERGITTEKMTDLKIESTVIQQLGSGLFNNADGHYFDYEIGQEMDHLSSLMRTVVQRYVRL